MNFKFMIKSQYIYDILTLLCDGDEEGMALHAQIPYLTESRYDYTGGGVFVGFSYSPGIKHIEVKSQITL